MIRADYAGDGSATTRNGQPINIYDKLGIQSRSNAKAYEFEAGWTDVGAVGVRHVRVKENATLAGIAAHSPRLAGSVGDVWTEAYARARRSRLVRSLAAMNEARRAFNICARG